MNFIKKLINKFKKNKTSQSAFSYGVIKEETKEVVDYNSLDTTKLIQRKIDRKRKYLNTKIKETETFRNKLVKRVATEYDNSFVNLYEKEIGNASASEKNIRELLNVTNEEAIQAYLDKATIQKLYDYIEKSKKIIKNMKNRNTPYAKKFISRFKVADISNADILANLHTYINNEDMAKDADVDEIVDSIDEKSTQGEQLSFLDKID